MVQDKILANVATRLKNHGLPVAIKLWNGAIVKGVAHPKITLALNSPASLKLFLQPNLSALAESYLKQEIDVDGEIRDVMRLLAPLFRGANPDRWQPFKLFSHTKSRDRQAIRHHYDVSNEFYALWLDAQRIYSCAYFKTPDDTLDAAQEQKVDHICKKLVLKSGERLLDIGCGWGALIFRAAEKYGARCEGITLSEQQHAFVQEEIDRRGLHDQVKVRLEDYRDVAEDQPFDKIVSVGMFEHVGVRLLPTYFAKIHRLLKPGGVVMNHGITRVGLDGQSPSSGSAFIEKYIFPDGELTHVSHVIEEMVRQGFEVLDVESLRRHYAQTLWHWVTRLEGQQERARQLVGEEKYRTWRAYLAGFAYAFEQGWNNIYQILAIRPAANGSIDYPMTREHVYRS